MLVGCREGPTPIDGQQSVRTFVAHRKMGGDHRPTRTMRDYSTLHRRGYEERRELKVRALGFMVPQGGTPDVTARHATQYIRFKPFPV